MINTVLHHIFYSEGLRKSIARLSLILELLSRSLPLQISFKVIWIFMESLLDSQIPCLIPFLFTKFRNVCHMSNNIRLSISSKDMGKQKTWPASLLPTWYKHIRTYNMNMTTYNTNIHSYIYTQHNTQLQLIANWYNLI